MKTKKRTWKQYQNETFKKNIKPYVNWLMKSIKDNPNGYFTPEKVNELQMIIEFCTERNINLFD